MSENVSLAVRHARVRWIGGPLLLTGASLLSFAVYRALVGGSGWTIAMAAFGTGLALAAFGANHDTAMAYSFAGREESLPLSLREELNEELERDRSGVVAMRPTPMVGLVMPWVSACIQIWVCYRLFGAGV